MISNVSKQLTLRASYCRGDYLQEHNATLRNEPYKPTRWTHIRRACRPPWTEDPCRPTEERQDSLRQTKKSSLTIVLEREETDQAGAFATGPSGVGEAAETVRGRRGQAAEFRSRTLFLEGR